MAGAAEKQAPGRGADWHEMNMRGQSFTAIADAETYRTGEKVTRSTVAGAISRYRAENGIKGPENRHGGRRDGAFGRTGGPDKKAGEKKPAAVRAHIPPPEVTAASYEAQVSDRHCCRYIHGDPKDGAGYCGARRQEGSSFCAAHHALCWRIPPKKERPSINRNVKTEER